MSRIFYLSFLIVLLLANVLMAQPPGGGGPPPDPMAPVPIPGIPLLVLLGAFLGIRNLARRKFLKDKS